VPKEPDRVPAPAAPTTVASGAHLAVRFVVEVAAVVVVATWGFRSAAGGAAPWLLGIGAPLVLIAFWGAVVAPRSLLPVPGTVKSVLAVGVLWCAAAVMAVVWGPGIALGYAALVLLNAAAVHRIRA
jgi:hypothetical protein